MGIDITSYTYPYSTELSEKAKGDEDHQEPGSELVRSSVEGYEHPLFSPKGLKDTLNLNRVLSNSTEKPIEKDIPMKVIQGAMESSLKNRIPYDLLIFAMDFEENLGERQDGSGADGIAQKMKGYVQELTSSLGRQPLNSEMFMAFALGSADKVKDVIKNATEKPNEEAKPTGSKNDKFITSKPKFDKEKKRTNKEVYQYFNKRMGVGNKTFAHTI